MKTGVVANHLLLPAIQELWTVKDQWLTCLPSGRPGFQFYRVMLQKFSALSTENRVNGLKTVVVTVGEKKGMPLSSFGEKKPEMMLNMYRPVPAQAGSLSIHF